MDWDSPTFGETFKIFKQRLDLYFQIKKIEGDKQVPIILLSAGEEGLQRYHSWNLTATQRKEPDTIWTKFEEQIQPKENLRVARLKLRQFRQMQNESLDTFVNRCKLQALKYDFTELELNVSFLLLCMAHKGFTPTCTVATLR